MSTEKKLAFAAETGLSTNCLRPATQSRSVCQMEGAEFKAVKNCITPYSMWNQRTKAKEFCGKQGVSTKFTEHSMNACTAQVNRQCIMPTKGPSKTALLATATVVLESAAGNRMEVRALIDPGSEGSFVSEYIVQALSLKRRRTQVCVCVCGE